MLFHNHYFLHSEDLHPIPPRRMTRKPAPPPPPQDKIPSVTMTPSAKQGQHPPQSQTWPRQAVPPQETDVINNHLTAADKKNNRRPSVPDKPNPPDRVSSLPGHGHSTRPTIPPPVVPGHQRSASTGTPVTVPGVPFSGSSTSSSMEQGKDQRSSATPDKDIDIMDGSNAQLSPDTSKLNTNSLNRQSVARPPRPLPPPPPPPENTITEETHL